MWEPALRKHSIKNSYTRTSCVSSCSPLHWICRTTEKTRTPQANYSYFGIKVPDAGFRLARGEQHQRPSHQLRMVLPGRPGRGSERVSEAPPGPPFGNVPPLWRGRQCVWLIKISCITFGKKREMSLPWHSLLSQTQVRTSSASRKAPVLSCQPPLPDNMRTEDTLKGNFIGQHNRLLNV